MVDIDTRKIMSYIRRQKPEMNTQGFVFASASAADQSSTTPAQVKAKTASITVSRRKSTNISSSSTKSSNAAILS